MNIAPTHEDDEVRFAIFARLASREMRACGHVHHKCMLRECRSFSAIDVQKSRIIKTKFQTNNRYVVLDPKPNIYVFNQ